MKIVESIQRFFSHFKQKQLLPSIIIRSGLPILYSPMKMLEKPKPLFEKLFDYLKSFLRDE